MINKADLIQFSLEVWLFKNYLNVNLSKADNQVYLTGILISILSIESGIILPWMMEIAKYLNFSSALLTS